MSDPEKPGKPGYLETAMLDLARRKILEILSKRRQVRGTVLVHFDTSNGLTLRVNECEVVDTFDLPDDVRQVYRQRGEVWKGEL